jgi:putative ABC transport system permease protein
MSYYNDGASIYPEGQVPGPSGQVPRASVNRISSDYFVTMRMKMLRGRTFTEADTSAAALVAIVNETFAKRLWPDQDPIGKRFSRASAATPPLTVVGEVRDSKTNGILDPPGAVFFVPEQQDYQSVHVLQLRTSVAPETLIPVVETQVRELDPNMPLFDVMTMEKSLNGANGYFLFRMGAAFAGTLGGLGMLLAVVGVYGVISFTASRRTHEIGVRMALGAHPWGIFALVLRQAILLVGIGVGIGLLASLGVAQLLKSLLVGVSSYDPFTFAMVAALLIVVTFVACYLPARRATRVDPSRALRYE